MHPTPRFLQGIFPFTGRGMEAPFLLDPSLTYRVPKDVTAQPVYFRGGNTLDEMICLILVRGGAPMRYFPVGAKAGVHVALRVIEDLLANTIVEVHVAAPAGCAGAAVVDLGIVEI
ncbi:MAG: molybdopterin oxidoreductase [Frankia sp.]